MIDLDEAESNLIRIFRKKTQKLLNKTALEAQTSDGYQRISWQALSQKVEVLASALHQIGIVPGDKVAILSENRPEWVFCDLAIMSLGAVVVPIYPTGAANDVSYVLEHSEAKLLFISTPVQIQRIECIVKKLKIPLVVFDSIPAVAPGVPHRKFQELLKLGQQISEEARLNLLNDHLQIMTPETPATIIYTSGTTGQSKGVVLTHRNFVSNYLACSQRVHVTSKDISISFLPLSHVFERLAGYYFMLFNGATVVYAQSIQTVADDLKTIRPTVGCSVPRFFEKMHQKIMTKIQEGPVWKRTLFQKALTTAKLYLETHSKTRSWRLRLAYLFYDTLLFSKIRKALGGRIRFFISGGAPLNPELADFFLSIGIPILEGYGLTETSPVIAVNTLDEMKNGTVGKPLPGCEVKIASDGEILVRGASIMSGYFKNPEETQKALEDGWFHTGDIGEVTPDGFLKITDRKKDIIKTSGGKMVAPQSIEKLLLSEPVISQVVVLGDKRNYLVALIVPNKLETQKIANQANAANLSWAELLNSKLILDFFTNLVHTKMQGLASFEQIKYFALLPQEFTIDAGELTPTLKIKRRFIQEKYHTLIEKLYQPSAPVVL